ncbi:hypothetical protein AAVH_22120 [Aphelenchoides avenae]|nr:hypothetical protein AAVH_22120 [Aphelenchus avenae]
MSVPRLIRRIVYGKQIGLTYTRWGGSKRRENNPVRIADHLLTRLPPAPAGWEECGDLAEYHQNEFYSLIKNTAETETTWDKLRKFPRHYFNFWEFISVESTMEYMRQNGLVDKEDMEPAIEALLSNMLEQPVLLLQAFIESEAVCKSEPYVRFLDGRGRLDIASFTRRVTPNCPRYWSLHPDIDHLKQLYEYSNASGQRRKVMLRDSTFYGSIFIQSLLHSVGQAKFEDGRLPRSRLRSSAFSGTCRKNANGVTVEMGTTEWYLHYEAVKDAAARLQAPILLVATAAELAGISSRVTRQGRIFYDAAVINGFRYNDKRLYAGEEYADLAIYSEYVGFGFTPWSDLL